MARVKDPVEFSEKFDVSPALLKRAGVLDPSLNVDTALFIDPLLLEKSRIPEMRRAAGRFRKHFENLAKLLAVSTSPEDVAWKAARRALRFSEVKGTCLGYGAGTIRGSGVGPQLTERLLNTAKEIVDLGVRDPDLFLSLSLIEPDIGPDRISDMVTNVILEDLAAYGERVAVRLNVRLKRFAIAGSMFRLPENPFDPGTPVLLVPRKILRPLPVAADWDAVCVAAAHNEALRDRVNSHIGAIWEAKSRQQKDDLRTQALSSRESFESLLQLIHEAEGSPYDTEADPDGLLRWRERKKIAQRHPLRLSLPPARTRTLDDVFDTVLKITDQFTSLVEKNGLWKDLWSGAKRRPEKAAQRLFFAVAMSYCHANNLDLSPKPILGLDPSTSRYPAAPPPRSWSK
jgi:hypothetical protein